MSKVTEMVKKKKKEKNKRYSQDRGPRAVKSKWSQGLRSFGAVTLAMLTLLWVMPGLPPVIPPYLQNLCLDLELGLWAC